MTNPLIDLHDKLEKDLKDCLAESEWHQKRFKYYEEKAIGLKHAIESLIVFVNGSNPNEQS